ncbi:MAG: helix-turn-helix transcriptional regulator [Balneolaceae bacterium]|nr:helix-turn-helix transcriptional regulator [Balneolaceae bacterium]
MILKQFPDLAWIRKQSREGFASRKAIHNITLPHKGWPNVVLNARSYNTERNGITAPFSLFFNLKGSSTVISEENESEVTPDTFSLVNSGALFGLRIDDKQPTETFNIHFGSKLFKESVHSFQHTHLELMDFPLAENTRLPHFFSGSRWLNPELRKEISALYSFYRRREIPLFSDEEDMLLNNLILKILKHHTKEYSRLQSLSSLKKSTRLELYKRLTVVIDYIHSNYNRKVLMDELSEASLLSKYHMLHSFREAFNCTPHQYLMNIRLKKAEELLLTTNLEISEIADQTGFAEPNSFSRFFKNMKGVSPTVFRDN